MGLIATFITDASWSDRTRCGGWAGRLTFQGQRHDFWGPVKTQISGSGDAELAAVVNTVSKSVSKGLVPRNCGWLIQTDNTHVVRLMNHHFQDRRNRSRPRTPPRTTAFQDLAVEKFREIVEHACPEFVLVRWVKGHVVVSNRDPKHHVQERMDQLAGQGRRLAEQERMSNGTEEKIAKSATMDLP